MGIEMESLTGKIAIRRGEGNVLLIIDAQNDFILRRGALYVKGLPQEQPNGTIIARIIALAERPFDYKGTSEDYHPDDHIEFEVFKAKHCVEGTVGQKYHKDLLGLYHRVNANLVKGRHPSLISYSVATSEGFASFVRDWRFLGIKRMFLVGWAYNFCVGESAIALAMQGFETYVIRDCTRSVPSPIGDPEAMDEKLRLYGVKQVLFSDIR